MEEACSVDTLEVSARDILLSSRGFGFQLSLFTVKKGEPFEASASTSALYRRSREQILLVLGIDNANPLYLRELYLGGSPVCLFPKTKELNTLPARWEHSLRHCIILQEHSSYSRNTSEPLSQWDGGLQ